MNLPQAQTIARQNQSLANYAAMASLLNLTLLPGIGFAALLILWQKTLPESLARYHAGLGIKLNLVAAVALLLVTLAMLVLGGFQSPWIWAYIISYFTVVHTFFILAAVWVMVRAWNGQQLSRQ